MEKVKTEEFQFKDIDHEGMETLEAISGAVRFNTWMFDTIKPYVKGDVLEIGSGIGNMSSIALQHTQDLTISDIRDNYCSYLSNHFGDQVKDVLKMDIIDPDFDQKHQALFGSFDTVFALNIVEHVKDDVAAMKNIKKLLKPGGKAVILVPAYQSLYNNFDKELEHYRRYTLQSLTKILRPITTALFIGNILIFSPFFGWWFSGNVLKKKTVPSGQMKLFDTLVPAFKVVDKVLGNKIGISAIVVGEKDEK
jgi:2-polyprenyl-3-methyl-5-hydroxy-6-metoxy-1,4-benzoquinol methylase